MSKETQQDIRERLIARVGEEIYEFQNAADAVDDAAATILGLNPTDQRCLGMLLMRGPMTAGRLADGVAISAGAMTASLDRLERMGFVRRVRDEEDRRRVVVEATPEAREHAWSLYRPIADAGAARLATYTNEQLRLIIDFLREGSDLQLAYAERLRQVAPASIADIARDAADRLKAATREAKVVVKGAKADLNAQAEAMRDEIRPHRPPRTGR